MAAQQREKTGLRRKRGRGSCFSFEQKAQHQNEQKSELQFCHHVPFSSQINLFDVNRVIW